MEKTARTVKEVKVMEDKKNVAKVKGAAVEGKSKGYLKPNVEDEHVESEKRSVEDKTAAGSHQRGRDAKAKTENEQSATKSPSTSSGNQTNPSPSATTSKNGLFSTPKTTENSKSKNVGSPDAQQHIDYKAPQTHRENHHDEIFNHKPPASAYPLSPWISTDPRVQPRWAGHRQGGMFKSRYGRVGLGSRSASVAGLTASEYPPSPVFGTGPPYEFEKNLPVLFRMGGVDLKREGEEKLRQELGEIRRYTGATGMEIFWVRRDVKLHRKNLPPVSQIFFEEIRKSYAHRLTFVKNDLKLLPIPIALIDDHCRDLHMCRAGVQLRKRDPRPYEGVESSSQHTGSGTPLVAMKPSLLGWETRRSLPNEAEFMLMKDHDWHGAHTEPLSPESLEIHREALAHRLRVIKNPRGSWPDPFLLMDQLCQAVGCQMCSFSIIMPSDDPPQHGAIARVRSREDPLCYRSTADFPISSNSHPGYLDCPRNKSAGPLLAQTPCRNSLCRQYKLFKGKDLVKGAADPLRVSQTGGCGTGITEEFMPGMGLSAWNISAEEFDDFLHSGRFELNTGKAQRRVGHPQPVANINFAPEGCNCEMCHKMRREEVMQELGDFEASDVEPSRPRRRVSYNEVMNLSARPVEGCQCRRCTMLRLKSECECPTCQAPRRLSEMAARSRESRINLEALDLEPEDQALYNAVDYLNAAAAAAMGEAGPQTTYCEDCGDKVPHQIPKIARKERVNGASGDLGLRGGALSENNAPDGEDAGSHTVHRADSRPRQTQTQQPDADPKISWTCHHRQHNITSDPTTKEMEFDVQRACWAHCDDFQGHHQKVDYLPGWHKNNNSALDGHDVIVLGLRGEALGEDDASDGEDEVGAPMVDRRCKVMCYLDERRRHAIVEHIWISQPKLAAEGDEKVVLSLRGGALGEDAAKNWGNHFTSSMVDRKCASQCYIDRGDHHAKFGHICGWQKKYDSSRYHPDEVELSLRGGCPGDVGDHEAESSEDDVEVELDSDEDDGATVEGPEIGRLYQGQTLDDEDSESGCDASQPDHSEAEGIKTKCKPTQDKSDDDDDLYNAPGPASSPAAREKAIQLRVKELEKAVKAERGRLEAFRFRHQMEREAKLRLRDKIRPSDTDVESIVDKVKFQRFVSGLPRTVLWHWAQEGASSDDYNELCECPGCSLGHPYNRLSSTETASEKEANRLRTWEAILANVGHSAHDGMPFSDYNPLCECYWCYRQGNDAKLPRDSCSANGHKDTAQKEHGPEPEARPITGVAGPFLNRYNTFSGGGKGDIASLGDGEESVLSLRGGDGGSSMCEAEFYSDDEPIPEVKKTADRECIQWCFKHGGPRPRVGGYRHAITAETQLAEEWPSQVKPVNERSCIQWCSKHTPKPGGGGEHRHALSATQLEVIGVPSTIAKFSLGGRVDLEPEVEPTISRSCQTTCTFPKTTWHETRHHAPLPIVEDVVLEVDTRSCGRRCQTRPLISPRVPFSNLCVDKIQAYNIIIQ